jgi:phenylacetate-CoA ligase
MLLNTISRFEHDLLDNYPLSKQLITNIHPEILEKLSKIKAYQIYKLAKRKVPAYKKFLKNKKLSSIEDIPYTDKKNYIKKFPYELRCLNGKFPKTGNIDESSGSSGVPTNWIRSVEEEDLLFKAAKFEFNYTFKADKINYITLSAWSSGPWATGVKFCEIIERYTLVKNTTPDIKNIIRSLKTFGNKYNYIIGGYPPFLKQLFDTPSIKWKDYKINIITGGESIPLEWKDNIKKKLNKNSKIISSYGASDIDIGIGFETPFSEFVREQAKQNPKLNKELFKAEFNPMVFQYNPLTHYIENTKKHEYSVTILDPCVASPKVKYNVHDKGGKISYKNIIKILKKYNKPAVKKFLKKNKTLKLPFLYVIGRSDGTVSVDGANVYPEQIGAAIESNPTTSKTTNRFMIKKEYCKNQKVTFKILIETKRGKEINNTLKKTYERTILKKLMELNRDFKESYLKNKSLKPKIEIYKYNSNKDFKASKNKIKNKYII